MAVLVVNLPSRAFLEEARTDSLPAVGDPATRQLAANIRKPVAPGSEHLVLGDFWLGRNAASRVTGDQADYQGHRADLW